MTCRFIATVCQQWNSFIVTSKITVTQLTADNTPIVVAYINDSADPMDHRMTTIDFAEGRLFFSEAYDGPLREHSEIPFCDANHKRSRVALHCYFHIRDHSSQKYLALDSCFLPICITQNKGDFRITVYDALPAEQENRQDHPVLAVITKTKTYSNGYEYEILTNGLPHIQLLMAIFSLPFTLNLIIDHN